MLENKPQKTFKKTSIRSNLKSDRFLYLNLATGAIYSLLPNSAKLFGIKVVDGTREFTNYSELQKESLRIMDQYIRSNCL